MKVIFLGLALLLSAHTPASSSDSTTTSLLHAAIQRYLQEMKAQYAWTPPTFIIQTENKSLYSRLRQRYGGTDVLVKTTQELRDYSTHHVGRTIEFFNFDVEHASPHYQVFVLTESIRTTLRDGTPHHAYNNAQQGRACALRFDAQLTYQGIDCLVDSDETAEE